MRSLVPHNVVPVREEICTETDMHMENDGKIHGGKMATWLEGR